MSFFKDYDNIINQYYIDSDVITLKDKLESLLNQINNSVDDAKFSKSHYTIKKSINEAITFAENKIALGNTQ